ncbi:MAG: alkaline phosphatase family protein [Elusimicrobiota bacterium]
MRRIIISTYALAFFILSPPLFAKPKLIVFIIIDQMRADYFDRFSSQWEGGFKKFQNQGAFFKEAHHRHVPTETAPGHAVISTGRSPRQNGIIGNEWYDRNSKKVTPSVFDPIYKLSPENLKTPTLGDILKDQDPTTKVVSISLKDRSALFMGGKKANLSIWFDRGRKKFESSAYFAPLPSTIEEFNRELKQNEPALDGFSPTAGFEFSQSSKADFWLFKLALFLLEKENLGKDSSTDILSVSFSTPDYIGHRFGPDSEEIKREYQSLDLTLQDLIDEVSRQIGEDQILWVLTADHGVLPIPESKEGLKMGAKRIFAKNLTQDFEARLKKVFPAIKGKIISQCLIPDVYLEPSIIPKRPHERAFFFEKIYATLIQNPDIANIYIPGTSKKNSVTENFYFDQSYYAGRSGDFLVQVKPGILVTDKKSGTSHGTVYNYDTHVPLIFMGKGIKPQIITQKVSTLDIVPTIASCLDLSFQSSEDSQSLLNLINK